MALSPVDIYKNVLPKTNCGDCDFPTCLAFASMVVKEKIPLNKCPHLDPLVIEKYQQILNKQHKSGKHVKKDVSKDALKWAKKRASSIKIEDLQGIIGGDIYKDSGNYFLELPYLADRIVISEENISYKNGFSLNILEQVLIYNHIIKKGNSKPIGKWKAIEEFPNSVSKIVSMRDSVEMPLLEKFSGYTEELLEAAKSIGGVDITEKDNFADLVILFRPLPRIPIMLLFWEEDKEEGFDAKVKLLFDETIAEHLDLESIIFLSERLRKLLCEGNM
ncbi:MAG: DUF3786 domain-containing protein [Thermodesulfobacteriota bacterium]|nr:DUF3786 domain-containing protein [Thermodesulfobacteriota bacterium]